MSKLVVGLSLLIIALILQTVTVAGGSYAGLLIAALILTAAADYHFIEAFRRGGTWIRVCSVLLLLPTLFVIADFIRRAPYVFR